MSSSAIGWIPLTSSASWSSSIESIVRRSAGPVRDRGETAVDARVRGCKLAQLCRDGRVRIERQQSVEQECARYSLVGPAALEVEARHLEMDAPGARFDRQ